MAWRSGRSLFSRPLMATARPPPVGSAPPPLPRLRPPSSASSRRLPSRDMGKLGCMQSFLPLHGGMAMPSITSRLNANVRAFCELSHGT